MFLSSFTCQQDSCKNHAKLVFICYLDENFFSSSPQDFREGRTTNMISNAQQIQKKSTELNNDLYCTFGRIYRYLAPSVEKVWGNFSLWLNTLNSLYDLIILQWEDMSERVREDGHVEDKKIILKHWLGFFKNKLWQNQSNFPLWQEN